MENRSFCINYVEQIFGKWDKDNSGILDRQEIKNWMREEMKQHPLKKAAVREHFH